MLADALISCCKFSLSLMPLPQEWWRISTDKTLFSLMIHRISCPCSGREWIPPPGLTVNLGVCCVPGGLDRLCGTLVPKEWEGRIPNLGNTCHSPLAEICCHDLADVTLVNVRGAVMQQVLIDLCLEGMKVQLCLPFLPPRARLGP